MTTISNTQLQSLWDRDTFGPRRGKTTVFLPSAGQASLWARDTYETRPSSAIKRVQDILSLWGNGAFAPRNWEFPLTTELAQRHLWECDTYGSVKTALARSPYKVRFSPRRIVHTYDVPPVGLEKPKLKRHWGSDSDSD